MLDAVTGYLFYIVNTDKALGTTCNPERICLKDNYILQVWGSKRVTKYCLKIDKREKCSIKKIPSSTVDFIMKTMVSSSTRPLSLPSLSRVYRALIELKTGE